MAYYLDIGKASVMSSSATHEGPLDPDQPDWDIKKHHRQVFMAAFGDFTKDWPELSVSIELMRNVHKTYHVLDAAQEEYLKPYNLTAAKFRLLVWLIACDKIGYADGLMPSQLSRFQGVSPNTVSALLSGAQEQGLIERVRHPTDHRKQIITITQTGRDLISQINASYATHLQNMFADLTHEECEILITLLHKLTHSIQSAVPHPAHVAEEK